MEPARAVIERLVLAPHPEGGWYRQTWIADAAPGVRAGGTAILFLLEAGTRSHWHTVDAAELWFWHAGAPIVLKTAPGDAGPVTSVTLGDDVMAGQAAQGIVLPHHWQAAEAREGWGLVSCVVVPGFDFAGFRMAAEGWAPGT